MKKSLDTTGITNELRGASLYFARERDQQKQSQPTFPTSQQVTPREIPVPVPPDGVPRTPVPPRRAIRQRQAFDLFEDQYRELKRIADDERNQGLPGSMSRMVREAIDQYLERRGHS
jgi:hypothetical protein